MADIRIEDTDVFTRASHILEITHHIGSNDEIWYAMLSAMFSGSLNALSKSSSKKYVKVLDDQFLIGYISKLNDNEAMLTFVKTAHDQKEVFDLTCNNVNQFVLDYMVKPGLIDRSSSTGYAELNCSYAELARMFNVITHCLLEYAMCELENRDSLLIGGGDHNFAIALTRTGAIISCKYTKNESDKVGVNGKERRFIPIEDTNIPYRVSCILKDVYLIDTIEPSDIVKFGYVLSEKCRDILLPNESHAFFNNVKIYISNDAFRSYLRYSLSSTTNKIANMDGIISAVLNYRSYDNGRCKVELSDSIKDEDTVKLVMQLLFSVAKSYLTELNDTNAAIMMGCGVIR